MKHSFLTPEEISMILKVDEKDVLRWLDCGEMKGIKIGDIWRIREDQFDEFINAKATGMPPLAVCQEDAETAEDETDYSMIGFRKPRTHKTPRRYAKLNEFFLRKHEKRVKLSFEQIEKLLERKLPDSAIQYRAFWANDPKHSQAKAWLEAGWCVEAVNMEGKEIIFGRKK